MRFNASLKPISKTPLLFETLYAAGHKPFDLAIERLITLLRFCLALFCLADLPAGPEPQLYDRSVFESILVAYTIFSLIIASLPTIARLRTGWQLPVHLIDIGVISYLVYFFPNLSSSFFILYVFVLLSATFRWNWHGAILTTFAIFVLQVVLYFTNRITAEFIVHSAFLFIMGGVFAFFGVGRERSANRLNQIASWPKTGAQLYAYPDDHWLTSSLAHIAATLQVPRIFIVWEIVPEPYLFTTFFAEGKCQHDRIAAGIFDNLVPVELQDVVFASADVKLKEYFTAMGPSVSADQVVDKTLQTKYKISSVCSAPFSGDNCQGRLFLLDRPDWGQEELSLTEIVAAHLCNEIEYYAMWTQLEETAANRERMRLFRDLHDGTLQSLAAAALQLKMIADHSDEKSRSEIDNIRRLILGEQRRIRAFAERRHSLSSEQPVKVRNIIQRKIKKLQSQWNCLIRLSVTPQDAILSNEILHQLEFLVAEAVANAVQHGEASDIDIAIEWVKDEVKLRIVDDGHGLPSISGSYGQAQLANLGIGPQSILKRITDLRGTISLISSRQGVELFIAIGCGNNAFSKNKDHALA